MVSSNSIKCQMDFINMMQNVVTNSGKYVFRRGNYHDCLELPGMKFVMVEFGVNGFDTLSSVGLCLPASCTNQRIIESMDSALKIVYPQISVLYIDSELQDYQYNLTWVSYLTVFILVSIIATVIFATLRRKHKNDQSKFFDCFDLASNLKYFQERKGETLNVFDGIRAVAMVSVILGHVHHKLITAAGIANTPTYDDAFSKNPFQLVIVITLVAVDVFLSLGGFFLAFVLLKLKSINLKVLFGGILQRVLRIWPCYILTMLFYYSLFMLCGSGMLWSKLEQETRKCSSMWKQMLFVSNFVNNGKSLCLDWVWYLQVDFQLFVVGLLLIYLYTQNRRTFLVISAVLSVLSLAFVFWYTHINNLKVFVSLSNALLADEYFFDVYIKPYGRFVPYCIGLVMGVLFMEYRKPANNKVESNQALLQRLRLFLINNDKKRILLEWLGITIMLFVTLIPGLLQLGLKWPIFVHSLYWAFTKPLFIVGMFLTILPSILGISHSLLNLVLTAKIVAYVSKISFCSYLIHLVVIYQFLFTRTYDVYYNLNDNFVVFGGMLILTLCLGLAFTMFVELPFANLVKLAFARPKQHLDSKPGEEKPALNETQLIQQIQAKDSKDLV